MLAELCGNQSVEKILLFLFVNTKCYGAQLKRLLDTPLTSLQNGFNRLENAGIIASYYEGKTKLYQMNPAYPLLEELKQLIKKAYTLLPADEKKLYSLAERDHLEKRAQMPLLIAFWARLKSVKHFTVSARSQAQSEGQWNGKGRGEVQVSSTKDNSLIFQERGTWQMGDGSEINFSNIYRWTLDRQAGMISLEHLRLGPDHPVFLFHLVPAQANLMSSLDSHLCELDAYFAQVPWDRHSIRLNWRVIGPKKDEEMQYCYL